MRDYKPSPTWRSANELQKREDNRMVWAAIALTWFLLSIDALTKI